MKNIKTGNLESVISRIEKERELFWKSADKFGLEDIMQSINEKHKSKLYDLLKELINEIEKLKSQVEIHKCHAEDMYNTAIQYKKAGGGGGMDFDDFTPDDLRNKIKKLMEREKNEHRENKSHSRRITRRKKETTR